MQSHQTLVSELSEHLRTLERLSSSKSLTGEESSTIEIAAILCTIFDDRSNSVALLTTLDLPSCKLVCEAPERLSSGESSPLRVVAWREWWDQEPLYLTPYGPITRSDVAGGACDSHGGFRLELVPSESAQAEFIGLRVLGEDQPWPCSPVHVEAVGRITREVLTSPDLNALLR